MVWPEPFPTPHPQNVHLHLIWLGVFVSALPLSHGTLPLNLIQEKQLLKENGCLNVKGLDTKEVMWKAAISIRKLIISNILDWLNFYHFKIR